MKEATGIQGTFKLGLNSTFLAKYDQFFSRYCVLFGPLSRQKCAYVCHDQKNEKESIYRKKNQNVKEEIDIQVSLILENKHQKEHFFYQNTNTFFGKLCVQFEPLLARESVHVCHNLRTEKQDI